MHCPVLVTNVKPVEQVVHLVVNVCEAVTKLAVQTLQFEGHGWHNPRLNPKNELHFVQLALTWLVVVFKVALQVAQFPGQA